MSEITAPMGGKLIDVKVKVGDTVNENDEVVIIEAMKMELPVVATSSGTVKEVRCKFCNSKNIIKYGSFRGIQRWWCKNCQRKFADNNALPGMKTDLRPITFAVGSYYDGVPVIIIIQEIEKNHCIYASDSTIVKWIDKFSKMAAEDTKDDNPRVGNTWITN